MTMEINQSNLYLLLPSKVAWLAGMVAEQRCVGIVDAVRDVYASETYRQLENEATKMWHLGPVALFEEFTACKATGDKVGSINCSSGI